MSDLKIRFATDPEQEDTNAAGLTFVNKKLDVLPSVKTKINFM